MTDCIPISLRQDLFSMFLSLVVGSMIGLERQARDKAAGLRTLVFICLGATLFTLLSQRIAPADPVRIAAQVVTGIGFLGAGVILRHGSRIVGVTTASVIWLTAALGMGIGAGCHALVLVVTIVAVGVLWGFRWITRAIDAVHEERAYHVGMRGRFDANAIDALLRTARLKCHSRVFGRSEGIVSCTLYVIGPAAAHARFVESVLMHPEVESFSY
jgi:putative Mg2+ transporter-C (MgtC) family protein